MAGDSLEHLQQQIGNLGDLHMIVRTMKALAAARIRQYEEAVAALAGYGRTVQLGLHVVLRELNRPPAPMRPAGSPVRRGLVVFGSDHGLCGRFNEEITEFALARVPGAHGTDGQTLIATVGARIADSLRHAGAAIAEEVTVPASPPQITATVAHLLYLIDDWREHQQLHELILCYNRHQGSKTYQSTELLLLPLDLRQFHRLQEERWPSPCLPTFSMDRALLLSRLLHQYLFVCIFRACAESLASEHAARLEAMHAAQRNVDERLELLTTSFRRTRQEAITAELLDVVSGFESVSATLP